eukprot:gb/GEZN01018354.1/.p1 GENE.gb/GEZN01018354.1/~~gb/GEZN01018354.1/.p1  ORF type:complete len:230 (+),score=27.18 gb/GEZN01018354.1/:55-690(+)
MLAYMLKGSQRGGLKPWLFYVYTGCLTPSLSTVTPLISRYLPSALTDLCLGFLSPFPEILLQTKDSFIEWKGKGYLCSQTLLTPESHQIASSSGGIRPAAQFLPVTVPLSPGPLLEENSLQMSIEPSFWDNHFPEFFFKALCKRPPRPDESKGFVVFESIPDRACGKLVRELRKELDGCHGELVPREAFEQPVILEIHPRGSFPLGCGKYL